MIVQVELWSANQPRKQLTVSLLEHVQLGNQLDALRVGCNRIALPASATEEDEEDTHDSCTCTVVFKLIPTHVTATKRIRHESEFIILWSQIAVDTVPPNLSDSRHSTSSSQDHILQQFCSASATEAAGRLRQRRHLSNDGRPETAAEVAIDERVDAAVGSTEPLRHWKHVSFQGRPLSDRNCRVDQNSDVERIQRQPRDGKQYKHDDQHTNYTTVGSRHVDGGSRIAT
jgi:hypothetical protein